VGVIGYYDETVVTEQTGGQKNVILV